MSVTQSEVLEYAKSCLRDSPNLSAETLRAVLRARFVEGRDPLAAAAAQGITLGAVANPMDWLLGLALVFRGLARIFGPGDKAGILDIIDGVVKIVSEPEAPSASRPT